ncbi:tol-pal system YbgF family protein [Tropicimonas sp. IMCC6043]|uniref:tetratricopeptide repeat protein n=1 Tax=Tropicimonas sp. IMCC6043 TaxID=2510645 RepID=UPI00101B8982|nr:tetratricopeptide repeat protein [Tropicimonas sp. IMCC6043]RYH08678.1 tetratricopeptide repeat protein [Tropicimonas sp. IMCC6043]
MLARFVTGLFYAAVFFALGAWSGGHLAPIWGTVESGFVAVKHRLAGGDELSSNIPDAGKTSTVVGVERNDEAKSDPQGDDARAEASDPENVLRSEVQPTDAAPRADTRRPEDVAAGARTAANAAEGPEPGLAPARKAFAEGDIHRSIASYLAYLARHPDDARAHGELGNVFFNGGQTVEAAKSFYAAALLLIADGQPDEARALEPAIRTGAPYLATDLLRRLDTDASPPDAGPTDEADT